MNRGLIVVLALVALGVGFGIGIIAAKPEGVSLEKYNAVVKERDDLKKQAEKASGLQRQLSELEQKSNAAVKERDDLKRQLRELEQKLTRLEKERDELQQRLGELQTAEIDAAMMRQLKEFLGTSQPFDAPLPQYLFKVLEDGTALFLHFDEPLAEGPTKILYIGTAVPGKFCNTIEVQTLIQQGFVHFHTTDKVPTPEEGHGGKGGEDGYWLRHIAVGEFDMPWGRVMPGIDYNFMPTLPPDCP